MSMFVKRKKNVWVELVANGRLRGAELQNFRPKLV